MNPQQNLATILLSIHLAKDQCKSVTFETISIVADSHGLQNPSLNEMVAGTNWLIRNALVEISEHYTYNLSSSGEQYIIRYYDHNCSIIKLWTRLVSRIEMIIVQSALVKDIGLFSN